MTAPSSFAIWPLYINFYIYAHPSALFFFICQPLLERSSALVVGTVYNTTASVSSECFVEVHFSIFLAGSHFLRYIPPPLSICSPHPLVSSFSSNHFISSHISPSALHLLPVTSPSPHSLQLLATAPPSTSIRRPFSHYRLSLPTFTLRHSLHSPRPQCNYL